MQYRSDKGFTTAELMIGVAMLGILAAMATPALHRWLATVRVDTAARAIASALQLSKMRAIAENRRYRMSFDLDQNTYIVQKETVGGWQNVEGPRALGAGFRLASISEGRNPLYFEPLGTMPSGNATIVMHNAQGRTRILSISTGGRVKVR